VQARGLARGDRIALGDAMRILLVVCVACAVKSQPPPTEVRTCQTDLAPELAKLNVPGLAAGIIKNGKLACTAAAGFANIEEQRPATADTLFLLASTSKTVTATAVMQLVDDGAIALDDAISTHLPFQVVVPKCPTGQITIRHLLTHTSSIKDSDILNCPGTCAYGSTFASTVTRGADSPIPLGSFVESYLQPNGTYYSSTANFEAGCPGTINDYSNMGVTLAGFLAEHVGGAPLEQLTHDRIFTPLGMTETSWRLSDIDPDHLAMPYDWSQAAGFTPYGQFGEPDWPDGDLRSSVSELSRFLLMFMQGGELDGVRVLSADTVREMRRQQIPILDAEQGLIWFYNGFGNARPHVLGHDGSDNGTSSYMFFDPADGAGVILLSNGMWSDANDDSPAADALMAKLFAESTDY
jgi:CubicO group peptidase (beta-lactamase class C family)